MFEGGAGMTFGTQFKRIRKSHNLSVVKMARATGCGVTAIGNWEADIHLPNPQNLDRLINALPWSEVQQLRKALENKHDR